MRQPGNEFKIDPFKAIGTIEIPAPVIPAHFQKDHERWAIDTILARQHKFCANLCVNFTSTDGINESEKACFKTCSSKFSTAFKTFGEEQDHFFKSL